MNNNLINAEDLESSIYRQNGGFDANDGIGILVDMAKQGKIDPWHIDILDVTEKYLARMIELKSLNLRVASRTLLFASILCRLQSNVLAGLTLDEFQDEPEQDVIYDDDGFIVDYADENEEFIPTSNVVSFDEALQRAEIPLRNFMFKHTREKDLSLFYSIAQMDAPQNKDEVPTIMLAAAYVISELKTAFSIGFLIYIPFLIVDMVVSSTLLAMGMMMLPPAMISMPFKLLLFVTVDGWELLFSTIAGSFH